MRFGALELEDSLEVVFSRAAGIVMVDWLVGTLGIFDVEIVAVVELSAEAFHCATLVS